MLAFTRGGNRATKTALQANALQTTNEPTNAPARSSRAAKGKGSWRAGGNKTQLGDPAGKPERPKRSGRQSRRAGRRPCSMECCTTRRLAGWRTWHPDKPGIY